MFLIYFILFTYLSLLYCVQGLALYRCSECSFVSIRASHLRRHKMSHAQQVLHCHLCAYTCDDQKLLDKHVRVKHHTPKQPSQVLTILMMLIIVIECLGSYVPKVMYLCMPG